MERTGIRERRIAAPEEALSDLAFPPRARRSSRRGSTATEIDLIIVATVTPDMVFPSTGAILADQLGADGRGRLRPLGRLHRLHVRDRAGATGWSPAAWPNKALVVGGDVLSKILDWTDRSTLVLFGDGAGAVVLERVADGGFLGFELGADGSGGAAALAARRRLALARDGGVRGRAAHFVKMNGREVFKFATRVMVSSAETMLTSAASRSRTSTSTSRTRRTCASSSTRGRSSGSRRRRR